MAKKKLKSIVWPNLPNDTYILDAGEVEYSESESYDGGTVGKALQQKEADLENIINASTVQTLSDKKPYLFRQTPKAGHSEFDTLVGGSVAFNQLVQNGNFADSAGWSGNNATISVSNGVCTVTTTGNYAGVVRYNAFDVTENHKYLISCYVVNNTDGTVQNAICRQSNYSAFAVGATISAGASGFSCGIGTASFSGTAYPFIRTLGTNVATGSFTVKNVMAFDLTQMFGSTVADAIYAMEQATAGSGVAYFRSLFGEDYYAYNAGELKSVEGVSAHVMRDADENIIGSYPLDSTLTLRGIPKWNNGLYYDGDVYEADGTVNRKYGIVDLGTLTWSYVSGANSRMHANISDIVKPSASAYANIICSKYATDTADNVYAHTHDKTICVENVNARVWVYDSSAGTDASAFKTAMSGVYLIYEKATASTETAQPYQKAQICDPSGTEEYVSTSIVPVGHETEYPMTITDIAPTSNGTYTLKCTVSGGVKTYEWVSA